MASSNADSLQSDTTEQLGLTVYTTHRDGVRVPRGQKLRLLKAMQAGERLTIYNAMVNYRCGALHQRIKELRDDGWPILRAEKRVNGATVAEFFMDAELRGERDEYPLREASYL